MKAGMNELAVRQAAGTYRSLVQLRPCRVSVAFVVSLLPLCTSVSTLLAANPSASDRERWRTEALSAMQRGFANKQNPGVRIAAVEAMEASGQPAVLPWLRLALDDPSPAVRFAALCALGRLSDSTSRTEMAARTEDPDPNVRLAALFALHRLGDDRQTGKLATYLLNHDDAAVRRNAALVFGFMNSKGAVKMLARAMSDRDEGVRHYALEALSRQGNPEAQQELVFMTNSGVGSEEVFALQALGAARATECNDTFRYKLANAVHMETKLAAAWALGRTGSKEGVSLAKRALMNPTVRENDMKDPIADQVARVRIMAATALGAMGDPSTLKVLASVMSDDADPRLVQAAARAIVEILRPLDRVGLPFGGLKE